MAWAGSAGQEAPAGDRDLNAVLALMKQQQKDAAQAVTVFHDFQLVNQLESSGITFRHRIVDDGGKHYKPVHYDHGNGMAAADVDGDG